MTGRQMQASSKYGIGRLPLPGMAVILLLALAALLAFSGASPALAGSDGGAKASTDAPKGAEVGAKAPSDASSAPVDTTALTNGVMVYYFHTTKRCVSCRKIEAFAQEAVVTGFPEEIKGGKLAWRLVNVEDKGNEHYVADYQLYTKSVLLVELKDGKPGRWKNLPKIWEYLNDKTRFARYVQDETRAFLAAGEE